MALDFLAGCIGGAAGVIVGHPLDTIKVRLQTQSNGQYRGIIHCFTSIVKKESPSGLYKGISSPLTGLAFINAICFGVYGNTLRYLNDSNSYVNHFLAGALGGLAQSVISSPMELVKLRLQVQGVEDPNNSSGRRGVKYKSPFDCTRQVLRKSGVKGLYRGLGITIMRDCPALGVYFMSYEWLTRRWATGGPETLTTMHLLNAGGLAGALSWLLNYPTDVVKTRFQADGCDPTNCKYSSYRDCIMKSYREHGIRTFTQGLGSTLLRAVPTNAVTFFTVEWVFRICSGYIVLDHDVEHCPHPEHHFHPHHWEEDHKWFFPLPEAGATVLDPYAPCPYTRMA